MDYIFHPRNLSDDGIIVELKMDKTPEEAIQQIKDKKICQSFRGIVGRETVVRKTHPCGWHHL